MAGSGSVANISNSQFTNGFSSGGSAVFFHSTLNGQLNLVDVTASYGNSSQGASCIIVDGGNLAITGGSLAYCTSLHRGGAFGILNQVSITVQNMAITNNNASVEGGALAITSVC